MDSIEPPGLVVAKKIAGYGWRVVPAFCSKEGEKVPLAGNWVVNATVEETQLERWWSERPWTWPGTVSGVGSSIVFDCDGADAVDWFRALCARVGWVNGASLTYTTPGRSGGLHSVWSWPEWLGRDFRQAKVYLESGGEVQLRGQDHFTLLCGARRPDCPGRGYRIIEEPDGVLGPQELPEGLGRAFLKESIVSVGTHTVGVSSDLKEIAPSEVWAGAPYSDGRKNVCAGLAWYLAIRGEPVEGVIECCVRFGAECCVPTLSEETCRKKAEYAHRRAEQYRMKEAAEVERSIGRWARGRVWHS